MSAHSDKLRIGEFYTRRQLSGILGGDVVTYLPHKGEKVTCGCFDLKVNPYAPEIVPFGYGKKVVRYAELLAKQKAVIPIFLKRGPNRWEYQGKYRAVSISSDPRLLHPSYCGRKGAVGVIQFEKINTRDQSEKRLSENLPDVDLSVFKGQEGRPKLLRHLRRERNPKLAKAKKQLVLKQNGRLICEVCNFDFSSVLDIGHACCEVHHLRPLSVRDDSEETLLKDLAILCSNCHRMIHRTIPLLTVRQLKQRIKKTNNIYLTAGTKR